MKKIVKNKFLISSVLVSLSFSASVLAEEDKNQESEMELAEKVEGLKTNYSTAELLTALNLPISSESKFHGSLGTNIEVERMTRSDGVNEGKVKYTLAQGNFRHDDLPGWDFGFYSAREELFSGNLKHASYDRGVNSIQEVFVNKRYNLDDASIGWGLKLAGESIDKRTTPEVKIFGHYQLTDNLEFHGYAMYHVEYKRGTGEFPYWEIEPGFGYKISNNSGAWLNLRYQVGQWDPKSGSSETETEWIIKPGVWHSWGELSASLWGEFGSFEKEGGQSNQHLWTEDYAKVGISANYSLSKNWHVFSEVSYKKLDIEAGYDREALDGYLPLFLAGINYNF